MSGSEVISSVEIQSLSKLGFSSEAIRFGHLTFESDQFLCCKDTDVSSGKNVLKILDLREGRDFKVDKLPMNGESAIMNPEKTWLAIRKAGSLQVFDTEKKQKVASQKLALDEEEDSIIFWTWLDSELIGIVSKKSVYHWSTAANVLEKVFDVSGGLQGSQVVAYKKSFDGMWLSLTSISKGETPGTVSGQTKLYSVKKSVSQSLESHGAVFAKIKKERETKDRNLFCFVEKKGTQDMRLFIMEVGKDKNDPSGVFKLPPKVVVYPDSTSHPNDFPVGLLFSEKEAVLYLLTKEGFLFLFDIFTGNLICSSKVTNDTFFATVSSSSGKGIVGVTVRTGLVQSFKLNEANIIPHLLKNPENASLAIKFAQRLNLPGADDLFVTAFESSLGPGGSSSEAARIAATAPGGILRVKETLEKLKKAGNTALLEYFKTVMESGSLNKLESLELSKLVLSQKKTATIEKLVREEKVVFCEELGDLLMQSKGLMSGDEIKSVLKLAVAIYTKSSEPNTKRKAVEGLVQLGEFDRIVAFSKKFNYEPEYEEILENIVRTDPSAAEAFAKKLANTEGGSLIDFKKAADVFLQQNRVQEATSFLLDVLKNDRPEEADLQTKVIEMNVESNNINVVEAILSNEMFHHFDKTYIANLLEKNGLFKRALELYNDLEAVNRVLAKLLKALFSESSTKNVAENENFILKFCGQLSEESLLSVIENLSSVYEETKFSGVLGLIVKVGVKFASQIGVSEFIDFLESKSGKYDVSEAIFLYCSQLVNTEHTSKQVVQKLVEVGSKLGQFDVVIQVIKENELIPSVKEKLKNFFLIEELSDPRPFIHFCNRFKLVAELTNYLLNKNLMQHLEVYVEKVAPENTSLVVVKMLDMNASEDSVTKLFKFPSVKKAMNYEHLVEELEARNKLYLVKSLLEEKVFTEKSKDVVVNNALAKMYILTNANPEAFLKSNEFYDAAVIGAFCEKVDPKLALICYEKFGDDSELVELCLKNELFEKLAHFCFQKDSKDMWDSILSKKESEEGIQNRNVLAFVDVATSSSILSKCQPTLSSLTAFIKSLMACGFTEQLITLLDQLLLSSSSSLTAEEKKSSSLQNLLLLTAVKTRPDKVFGYISDDRLNSYDADAIAKQCLNATSPLKKEAVEIYKKFGKFKEAVEVMLSEEDIGSNSEAVDETINSWMSHMKKSGEFTESSESEVLAVIGKHLLQAGMFTAAVKYLVKAENPEDYIDVIKAGMEKSRFTELIGYLMMCRKRLKEKSIDSSIVYCLCKTGKKEELEEFLLLPNLVQVSQVGEKLLAEIESSQSTELYEFCVVLFSHENNQVKLCEIFISMKDFRSAFDAAKKANRNTTWTLLVSECVKADEMKLARAACLNIINNPESLEEIINLYKTNSKTEDLIVLLEDAVLNVSNANNAIFSTLAGLYVENIGYVDSLKDTVLLDFVRKYFKKLNVQKLMKSCEELGRFDEAFELFLLDGDIERALQMIQKQPSALFSFEKIAETLKKQNEKSYIRSESLYYSLMDLVLEMEPLKVSEYLLKVHESYVNSASPPLDCSRIIRKVRESDNLPLLKGFLVQIRKERESLQTASKSFETSNISSRYEMSVVNEAMNELLVEEEDHEELRKSIEVHSNFDHLSIANQLKTHELSQFRSIAAKLFMTKKKFKEALEICERDNQYDECLYYAKTSNNREICSQLLLRFGEKKNKEYFVALLTLCSDLVQPDVVLEISWKNGWSDCTMPFLINFVKSSQSRIRKLEEHMAEILEEREKKQETEQKKSSLLNGRSQLLTN